MESSSAVLYNPFTLPDHVHFPSFTDAFGDLLKIEAENLRKINNAHKDKEKKEKKQKDRTSKPNSINSNKNTLKSRSTTKKTKSMKCIKSKSKIYCEAVTPMPTQKTKKKNFMFSNPPKTNTNNNNTSNNKGVLSPSDLPITPIIANKSQKNESEIEIEPETQTEDNRYKKWNKPSSSTASYGGLCTPMPSKKKKFVINKCPINNKENMDNNATDTQNNSIIVTPAPTTKRKKKTAEIEEENEAENDFDKSVIMMADILSPNPNNRYELSSPAPNDTNARLLTKTPAKFPILMPPTPMLQGDKKRNALEEKLCNQWFNSHKPVLTPAKIRENPVKLYDPSKDMNATIMLEQMDTPFEDETETLTTPLAAPPPQLFCDISMIMPLNDGSKKKEKCKINKNFGNSNSNSNSNKSKQLGDGMSLEFDNSIFVSGGNSFAFDMNNNKKDANNNFKNKKDENDTMKMGMAQINQQFSDIKLHKTKKKTKRNKHKFGISKKAKNHMNMVIEESLDMNMENINGMNGLSDDLLNMDVMSDVEFFSVSGTEQKGTQTIPVLIFDESHIPKIRYNGELLHEYGDIMDVQSYINYTQPLRYNRDSIECFESIQSDSDNDIQKISMSYNSKINTKKKKQNGEKMLREYKNSKLAQNPNWTLCGSHNQAGDLI